MPRPARWLLVGALAVLVVAGSLAALSWWVARAYGPTLTRERVEAALAAALGRPARVERVVLRPWAGQLAMEGVAVAAGETWDAGTTLAVRRLSVQVGISSVWRRELVISRVRLEGVDARLSAGGGGRLALPERIPDRIALGPITARLGGVSIDDARVAYRDDARKLGVALEKVAGTARPVDGGLDVTVRARRLGVEYRALDETVEALDAAVRLRGQRLIVRHVTARWLGVTAQASGEVRSLVDAPESALDVDATGALAPLGARWAPGWRVDGTARVKARVNGPFQTLGVAGRLTVPRLRAGPVEAGEVAAKVVWRDGRLRLHDIAARGLGGAVRGSLALDPARLDDTRVSARLDDVAAEALEQVAGRRLGLRGRVTVEADLAGDPRRPAEATGTVRVVEARLTLPGEAARLGTAAVSGQARLAAGRLDIERADGRWLAARLQLRGVVSADGPSDLHVEAEGDLAELTRPWGLAVAGNASLAADLNGRWIDPAARGTARATSLTVAGVGLERAVLPFDLRERTLRVRDAEAGIGESRFMIDATASLPPGVPDAAGLRRAHVKGQVRAPDARLEDAAPWLPAEWRGQGRLALTATITGTAEAWRAEGQVRADTLRLRAPLADVYARFALDPQGVEVARAQARVADVPVAGAGEWRWDGDGRLSADVGPARLHAIPGAPPALRLAGSAVGQLVLTRSGGRLSGSATLHGHDVAVAGFVLGEGEGQAALRDDAVKADIAFPAARVSAAATGPLTGPLDVRARGDGLSLETLAPGALPGGLGRVAGTVTAVADVRLSLADPAAARGAVVLDPVRVEVAGERWSNRQPVLLRRVAGVTHLDRLALESAVGRVDGSGTVHDAGPLDLRLRGRFPLALLARFRPEVREAGGAVEATVDVAGTLRAPEPTGEATVADGWLALRDYPEALRNLKVRLAASPGEVRIVSARATVGGGTLEASGELALENGRPGGFRVAGTARGVALAPTAGFETAWDADLELVGLGPRAQLRGEARLLRGSYERDVSLLRLLLERRPAAAPTAGGLHLDLRIALQDRLAVRTTLARLRADGTLSVQGTSATPVIFGTLVAHEGTVTFRRQTFSLTTATVRFADPRRIDPVLDVTATATIRGYDVTMNISGRADDLQIRLASSPPLPEEDVLSLVAFGATREQLGRSGAGAVAGEVAGFIVQDLFGVRPENQVVDVLEVNTSDAGGHTLRVGKQLTPRTLVVYSQGIESTEEQKVRLEYQVFGPLVVAGEQDFRGGFGADVLVRLRFR